MVTRMTLNQPMRTDHGYPSIHVGAGQLGKARAIFDKPSPAGRAMGQAWDAKTEAWKMVRPHSAVERERRGRAPEQGDSRRDSAA
jgi:hypothetical protein